jgi:ring-1,2-phenylacetyl-CoA epoxidase subunit PaaC
MFMTESFETTSGIVVTELETAWKEKIKTSFAEANIDAPENTFMRSGGKKGIHSEHLGFILAEMQYLQRSYPGCEW